MGLYENEPNVPSLNALEMLFNHFQHHLNVLSHANYHDYAAIFLADASINFGEKKVK